MFTLGIITLIIAIVLMVACTFTIAIIASDVFGSKLLCFIFGILFFIADAWMFAMAVYFFVKC